MDSFYRRTGKRIFDVSGGIVLAILTMPIQLVVALLVRKKLGSPVLYRQSRPGKDAVLFELVKFRTMTDLRDSSGHLLPDEQRLTPLGKTLRATSLDELPELYNVIRGDMSLVGPRPLLARYVPRYSTHQSRRHHVRPGITGLAQVSGRNSTSWEDRLELDVTYVENVSLRLDLRILVKTISTVVRAVGISAEGHATAPEFRGNSTQSG